VIAFATGCSYRGRLERWLGRGQALPDRVMEFQSYHAIIACVAAGTGIAIVPRSVIETTPAARDIRISRLPGDIARARTQLIWRPGHCSIALEAMKQLLTRIKPGARAS